MTIEEIKKEAIQTLHDELRSVRTPESKLVHTEMVLRNHIDRAYQAGIDYQRSRDTKASEIELENLDDAFTQGALAERKRILEKIRGWSTMDDGSIDDLAHTIEKGEV